MKVTFNLTLDGLIRALRWKAHALAEAGERSYAYGQGEGDIRQRNTERTVRMADDDRAER